MTGKLEETIRAALVKSGAASDDAREDVYRRFRSAILKTAADRRQDQATIQRKLALLDRTVADLELRFVEARLASALDEEFGGIATVEPPTAAAACPADELPVVRRDRDASARIAGTPSADRSPRRSGLVFAGAALAVASVAALVAGSQVEWFGADAHTPASIVGDQGAIMLEEMAAIAARSIAGAGADEVAGQVGDAVTRFGPEATRAFLAAGYRTIDDTAVRPLHFEAARSAYEAYGTDWAAYQLALDYKSGYGTPRDLDRAAELFEKLVGLGHGGAEYGMAQLLLDETYHSPDRARAVELLESAAAKGSPQAAALLEEARAGG